VTKKPKKLDFRNIVSSKGKSLEIFADDWNNRIEVSISTLLEAHDIVY
jgi:hypothetical protein